MARLKKQEVDRDYWVNGDGLVTIKKWVEDGLFDKQIANNIGITPKTLCEWKNKYETFKTVFDEARGVACLELVNATFKSAKGYYVNEQMIDANGNKRLVKKWIPGNTSAQIFLLKNWIPTKYKDRHDVKVDGDVNVKNPFAELTTEELRKLIES